MAKMKITKSQSAKSKLEIDSEDSQHSHEIEEDGVHGGSEFTLLDRSSRKRRKPARFLDGESDEESADLPESKRSRQPAKKPTIIVVKPKKKEVLDSPKVQKSNDESVKKAASEKSNLIKKDEFPKFCNECSETYEDAKAWEDHIIIWKCGTEPCPVCKMDIIKTSLNKHLVVEHNVESANDDKTPTKREPGVFEPSVQDDEASVETKKSGEADSIENREDICPYCAATMTRKELDIHIRQEHEEYVCDEEMDYFDDDPDTESEEPVSRKYGKRSVGKWRREWTVCAECGEEVMKGAVYKHMKLYHEHAVTKRGRKPTVTYPRQCRDCDEVLDDRRSYETHRMKKHLSKKQPILVVCEYCGRTYTKSSLWKHILTIHPEEAETCSLKPKNSRLHIFPRKCDQCEEVCENTREWDSHKAKHRPRKPLPPLQTRLLPCPHCAKQMVKSSIDRHIRMVHPNFAPDKPPLAGAKRGPKFRITWPRACPDCKQLFENKIRYDRHRSDGVCGAIPIQFRKNQVCSYCNQRFRRSEIGRHIKLVHCDLLPPEQRVQYPCRYPHCHKIYRKPSSRYSHELTHREEGHNRILQKRKEYRLNKKFLEKTLGFEGIEVQINEGDFRDENGNPTGAFTVTLEEVEDLQASKSIENIGLQTMAAIASHLEPSYEQTTDETGEHEQRIIQVQNPDGSIIELPESDARIIEVPEGDARIIQLPEGDFVQYGTQDGEGVIQYIQEGDIQYAEAVEEGDLQVEDSIERSDMEAQPEQVVEAESEPQPEPEPEQEVEDQEQVDEIQSVVKEEDTEEVIQASEEDDDKTLTLSQKPTTLKMLNCKLCNLLFSDSKALMEHFFKTHTEVMQEVTLTGFELVN